MNPQIGWFYADPSYVDAKLCLVRFMSLLGGEMLSFYDWYADLPPASSTNMG